MRSSCVFLAVLTFAPGLLAQSDWGSIKGTVTDASGGALDNVTVTAHMPHTGFHRSVITTRGGNYVIPSVPVGIVNLSFQRDGFQTLTFPGVPLATGQIWTRDAQLPVASRNEKIEVKAQAARLNRETAEIGDVIGGPQVSRLPLNGRNWQTLLVLAPGAVNTGNGDGRGVRFLGRGQDDNSFALDGVDATGIRNQVPRDDIRLAVPVDSVAEFRVRSGQYTAEAGGNMGAQVEIISRSGSNDFHGSLFEYFRNDQLDARSPFDPARKPPFRLNQFGGSIGGYLVKDRTFFFGNYEGLAQRLAQSETGFVPSLEFRARAIAATPAVAGLVNAYPVPNGTTSSPDIGVWNGIGSQDNDQHSGMFRLDHRFTNRDLFFARFNRVNMDARTPLLRDSTGQLGDNSNVAERITNGVLSYQKVFSPSVVNDARAGVNRIPYASNWDSGTIPQVNVAGFSTTPGRRRNLVNSTSYTYSDTLTWLRGRHTFKAGLNVRRLKMATAVMTDASTLTFQNPAAVVAGQFTASTIISPTTTRGVLKNQFFAFAQDEVKITPTLSATLGLRWEDFGVLHEEYGRTKPFDLATCGGFCPDGSPFSTHDVNNFAPRIGLAWSPAALHGNTVIRSGFGMYYGEGQLGNQLSPVENNAFRVQFNGTLPAGVTIADLLNNTIPPGTPIIQAPLNQERNRKDMYTSQWSLAVQQGLGAGFIGEMGYIGTKGTQLFQRSYANAINPATGTRPYPQFGLLAVRANGNNSTYHALTLSVRRQTASGLTMAANYQWSHAIDNDTTGGDEANYPQNVNCRSCERASSDYDVRHNFTLSSVYELPIGPGRRYLQYGGLAGRALSGWELSGMGVARTGRPVTVTVSRAASALPDGNATSPQRPDIVFGAPLVPESQSIGGWINLAAFTVPPAGRWGNAGRNLLTGPGFVNVDLALSKRTRLSERTSLEFRTEVFNVLNNAKYANPQANISAPATFGRITALLNTGPTGTGTQRQVEFALRLAF